MTDILMELTSRHGQLNVYSNRIEIIKTTGAKKSKSVFGNKTIFLNQITGIVFKEYTFLNPGYINFSVPGNLSSTMSRGGIFNAIQDENTFVYDKNDTDIAKEIKTKIEELIPNQSKADEIKSVPNGKLLYNDPDLIRKYKLLFDDGIITKEEYELKKKEILGL